MQKAVSHQNRFFWYDTDYKNIIWEDTSNRLQFYGQIPEYHVHATNHAMNFPGINPIFPLFLYVLKWNENSIWVWEHTNHILKPNSMKFYHNLLFEFPAFPTIWPFSNSGPPLCLPILPKNFECPCSSLPYAHSHHSYISRSYPALHQTSRVS